MANSIRNVSWLESYVALNLLKIKNTVAHDVVTNSTFIRVLYTEMNVKKTSKYLHEETRSRRDCQVILPQTPIAVQVNLTGKTIVDALVMSCTQPHLVMYVSVNRI